MSTANTIRSPDQGSPRYMGRRAWWLLALTLILPGSAQLLAGSRRLGRFALVTTVIMWSLVIASVLVFWLARPLAYRVITNSTALWIIQFLLALYAVLWLVLFLNTLVLIRLIKLGPVARVAVGLAVATVLVAGVGVLSYGVIVTGASRNLIETVFPGTKIEEPINGRYAILVLGGDAGPDRLGMRPDSIQVVSIDASTGASTIIGIPRNMQRVPFSEGSPLWEPFPDGYDCGVECLVSYLYTYGQEHPELYPDAVENGSQPGIEAMRDAVEGITGLPLQYFVIIDMQGFSELIDALGGVTVDSTGRYPIGGSDGSDGRRIVKPDGYIEPGVQLMDGYTALWYARSRHGTSDYDRMQRQHQVEEAILQQFEPATVLTRFQAIAQAGSNVATTDIPQSMLALFVELGEKGRTLDVATVELIPENGVDMVYPDFEAIRATITAALAPPPTPSATPTP